MNCPTCGHPTPEPPQVDPKKEFAGTVAGVCFLLMGGIVIVLLCVEAVLR